MMYSLPKILNRLHSLIIERVSRHYIAGPNLVDAISLSQKLTKRGYSVTLGYWDGCDDGAAKVKNNYIDALRALGPLVGSNYLSIKFAAIGNNENLFREVDRESERLGLSYSFDSLTVENNRHALKFLSQTTTGKRNNIGFTLPGRWKSSVEDIEIALELGLTVRVVKGQFATESSNIQDPNEGYLAMVRCLAGRARCVRIATHNPRLAEESLKILSASSTEAELEVLYGLPVKKLIPIARKYSVPVRIYIGYGNAYLPYAISSLRKNPLVLLKLLSTLVRFNYLKSFSTL